MIRKQTQQQVDIVEKPQNGVGFLTVKRILNGEDELDHKGRAFNHCFIEPGSGLGYHQHLGTTETIYVLKGQGEYTDDNGEKIILNPGDVTFTDHGESHGLIAIGDETLECITLILYKEN